MSPSDEVTTRPEDVPQRWEHTQANRGELAFAVAWCDGSPERVGEVIVLSASTHIFGRGGPSADDPLPRLEFVRERGGVSEPAMAITSPHVSRVQLRVRGREDGRVEVENVGRLRLLHNGMVVTSAVAREGDVLELGAQLLLILVRRSLTPVRRRVTPFPFGGPDSYGIVGESSAAWKLRDAVSFAGAHDGHVLVHGASGTGKELVARAVHACTGGAGAPLVTRNAATFPETLIDAELFGNARNYPNPGMPERLGLVGEADGGTLFLDEFAELPPAMQTHLLRVLDAGDYQRLGESRARTSSFRLVAATNRPLNALKEDVLARLVHRIEVPSLAARVEDVPLIARHLFAQMAAHSSALKDWIDVDGNPRFSLALVRALLERKFATNVRELEGTLWRAVASSHAGHLEPAPDDGLAALPRSSEEFRTPTVSTTVEDSVPAKRIQACLDENNGILEETWRALGLPNRHALTRLVKKYGLEVRKKSRQ